MESTNEKISGLRFHHIALKVKDFKKSLDFYINGLGLKPIVGWGEGNSEINMLDLGDGGILELFSGGENECDNGKWLHFAMGVDDPDAAYATAIAAGAKPYTAPKTVDLGDSRPYKMSIRIAFVLGPDDEQLEFFKVISKEG